jgi:hypothetical protein
MGSVKRHRVALAYAACVSLLCASLIWQEYPPCVDYPQHLALARQVRDLLAGSGSGRLVLPTYNGLFELTAGVTALVLPIGLSGRLVLASVVALTALAVWRTASFSGRPATHAFAWLPLAYSLPLAWGFLNFTLSAALATIALIGWYEKRSRWSFLLLTLLTGMAHVIGAAVLVVGAVIGVLLRARTATALLELAPLVAWVLLAHAATDPAPHLPWADQIFYPPWAARLRLGDTLLGPWHGSEDEWLAAGVGVAFAGALLAAAVTAIATRRYTTRMPFLWLSSIAAVVYATGPLALWGCWFFYQRFGALVTLWLPAVMPALPQGRWQTVQGALLVVVGALASVNFVSQGSRLDEASDARAIIEAIPRGARVAPVLALREGERVNDALRGTRATDALVWAHVPAYAVALRDAETTWMFGREHGHFAVRMPVLELELPPVEYSWACAYRPDAPYASVFDHVLVLTGRNEPTPDPTASVFGEAAANATLLGHRGRFWLFRYAGPAP